MSRNWRTIGAKESSLIHSTVKEWVGEGLKPSSGESAPRVAHVDGVLMARQIKLSQPETSLENPELLFDIWRNFGLPLDTISESQLKYFNSRMQCRVSRTALGMALGFKPTINRATLELVTPWTRDEECTDSIYSVLMHELGHALGKDALLCENPARNMVSEFTAWEWALENAREWNGNCSATLGFGMGSYLWKLSQIGVPIEEETYDVLFGKLKKLVGLEKMRRG